MDHTESTAAAIESSVNRAKQLPICRELLPEEARLTIEELLAKYQDQQGFARRLAGDHVVGDPQLSLWI